MSTTNRLTPMQRVLIGHAIGAFAFIVLWQAVILLRPGHADVRLVLAGLVGPVLCAGMSLLLIAAVEGRRHLAAPAPVQRRQVAAPQRRELVR